jgi:hypothetical protein
VALEPAARDAAVEAARAFDEAPPEEEEEEETLEFQETGDEESSSAPVTETPEK